MVERIVRLLSAFPQDVNSLQLSELAQRAGLQVLNQNVNLPANISSAGLALMAFQDKALQNRYVEQLGDFAIT